MAPPMVELAKRIWDGGIGTPAAGEAFYYCAHLDRPEWPNASPDEQRLRNWVWYRDLSGDIVVEQNIHVLDMCNWFLRGHPVKAVATCARKIRQDTGDCKDNFNAVLTYPSDVQITFGSTQFDSPEFDAGVRLFGSDGSSESHYDWRVKSRASTRGTPASASLATGRSSRRRARSAARSTRRMPRSRRLL